jgi:predicted DNA binding CopG/RHH family protein
MPDEKDYPNAYDLDEYEQEIEDNFEKLKPAKNEKELMALLVKAAKEHSARRKSITIRVHEMDLEAMRIKASKVGVPYQTYINMLIHKDATHI